MKVDEFIKKYTISSTYYPTGGINKVVCKFDEAELVNLVARKCFKAIASDQESFSLLYIKSGFALPLPEGEYISYHKEDNTVEVAFEVLSAVLKKIEVFRKFCLDAVEKRTSVTFYSVDTGIGTGHLFVPFADPPLDLTGDKVRDSWPDCYLRVLPLMSKEVGLSFVCAPVTRKAVTVRGAGEWPMDMGLITLTPDKTEHLVYPLPPKPLPDSWSNTDFFSLYEKGKFTDFNLISVRREEGGVIVQGTLKIHKTVLYLAGGDAITAMMEGAWTESASNSLEFEYSLNTLELFAQYLYRGPKGFQEHVIKILEEAAAPVTAGAGSDAKASASSNLSELYMLANQWRIEPLIDCCANLISLVTGKEHLPDVRALAHLTDVPNEHLVKLSKYLETSEKSE